MSASADGITIRLSAATADGTNALRSALGDLNAGLANSGQRATAFLADGGGSGSFSSGGQPGAPSGHPRLASNPAGGVTDTPEPALAGAGLRDASRLLDLRL